MAQTQTVRQIMQSSPLTFEEGTPLLDAARAMRDHDGDSSSTLASISSAPANT